MKALLTILALMLMVACGSDDHENPAPQAEDLTFSVEKLQARYELIAGGHYYFNEEKDDWKNSPSLLPLSTTSGLTLEGGELVRSDVTCNGKPAGRITQSFSIALDGRVVTGSSDFKVVKVVALDNVYEVIASVILLDDKQVTTGSCN